MIVFVILAFVIVGLLNYWIFIKVSTPYHHLTHKIKTGAGDEQIRECQRELMWARMLTIKAIMFCVLGAFFAIGAGLAQ